MLCDYFFNLLFVDICILSYLSQELTCFKSSDRKCLIVKVRNSQFFLHLLYILKRNPGGYQKVKLSIRNLIDVINSSVIAKYSIGSKSDFLKELLQLS